MYNAIAFWTFCGFTLQGKTKRNFFINSFALSHKKLFKANLLTKIFILLLFHNI